MMEWQQRMPAGETGSTKQLGTEAVSTLVNAISTACSADIGSPTPIVSYHLFKVRLAMILHPVHQRRIRVTMALVVDLGVVVVTQVKSIQRIIGWNIGSCTILWIPPDSTSHRAGWFDCPALLNTMSIGPDGPMVSCAPK